MIKPGRMNGQWNRQYKAAVDFLAGRISLLPRFKKGAGGENAQEDSAQLSRDSLYRWEFIHRAVEVREPTLRKFDFDEMLIYFLYT